jgi:hypothetical protein
MFEKISLAIGSLATAMAVMPFNPAYATATTVSTAATRLCGTAADQHQCASFTQAETATKTVVKFVSSVTGNRGVMVLTFTGTARCGGTPVNKELVFYLDLQITETDSDPEPLGAGSVRVGITANGGTTSQTLDVPISVTRRMTLKEAASPHVFRVRAAPTWLRGNNLSCSINGGQLIWMRFVTSI